MPELRKSQFDAEAGSEFFTGRDLLNAFLVLKGTLLVVIGQAPAWLDTEEWSAIGP